MTAWLDARCFRASAAAKLAAGGVTPKFAAEEWEGGDTFGHAVANGDLLPSDVINAAHNAGEVAQ